MSKIFGNKKVVGKTKGLNNWIRIIVSVTLVVFIWGLFALNSYTEGMNDGLADSLIRLHVIANSDSPEDQSLKRDVRDEILAFVQSELKLSENIDQTRAIMEDKLGIITQIAKEKILDKGKSYNVQTTLGSFPFPTKTYGDITLPAGDYQALRVVIGNGNGANWWCVLFPPLCFVDVTHGTVPDSVKEDLKGVLSKEEYDIVTSSDEESDIPVKIKFKIVEMFQDSKVKIAGTLDKLFKPQG